MKSMSKAIKRGREQNVKINFSPAHSDIIDSRYEFNMLFFVLREVFFRIFHQAENSWAALLSRQVTIAMLLSFWRWEFIEQKFKRM